MAKISSEQKRDNYRNMRAMINDYRDQQNRHPTIKEFEEKLGLSESTVFRYKKTISSEDTKEMLDEFQDDMKYRIKKTLRSIDKGVEILEGIQNDAEHSSDVISATKAIKELNLDAVRIMRDGPGFLNLNYDESNEHEYIHRETNSDKITESIETMFS